MKRICIYLLLLFSTPLFAQVNLVPNPSFEDMIGGCPYDPGEVYKCAGWSTFGHTPDYFNSCSADTIVNVPVNFLGYQNAASGNAYCGFYNFIITQPFREYVGSQLLQSLIIGQEYFVSFKVSLADKVNYRCASNKVGVRFSTVAFDTLNLPPLNNYAQVYTDSLISDTATWILIKGSFIADSNYTYIIIGNFFTDANTLNNCNTTTSQASYMYVDDVCVSTDSNTCYIATGFSTPQIKNNFSIFPNPFQDYIDLKTNIEEYELSIFSSIGRVVFQQQIKSKNMHLQPTGLSSGIYMLRAKTSYRIYSTKIIRLEY